MGMSHEDVEAIGRAEEDIDAVGVRDDDPKVVGIVVVGYATTTFR